MECRSNAVPTYEHTRRKLNVSITGQEHVGSVSGRHVVGTTEQIENVVAVIGGCDGIVTNFEAELIAANEERPIIALSDNAVGRG
jgi:hypothetical protein